MRGRPVGSHPEALPLMIMIAVRKYYPIERIKPHSRGRAIAALCQNAANDVGFFDAGEFGVEAAEGVGELFVVDAEAVEHRGVEVGEVDWVVGDVVAEMGMASCGGRV